MSIFDPTSLVTRRRALLTGAGLTGGLLAASLGRRVAFAQDEDGDSDDAAIAESIQDDIENIIEAEGSVSDGVFAIEIDRDDITSTTLHGVPIKPAFQINGDLNFQPYGDKQVIMNSDLCLKAKELDAFIHELISHDIVFQAEHQHLYDLAPIVWFIHFRAVGDPIKIAKGIKAALNVTSTPFPQTSPSNPTTPLPADEIGKILGAKPTIGADGVVTYQIPRKERITLGGLPINPYLNVSAPVAFQPYGGGQNAAAVPDFGMLASEINPVVGLMQKQGWDIGCLYNQETDEKPQLYFSHQFKTGDSIQLAKEIRNGFNLTNSRFQS
ncbi:putative CONSERVED LIPOPROTEIN LPQO [Acidisarcina polymorpha]|uniref:Putative CONSERVED LIPOPROTEIN LPQO n=1 Tax=Acidisarcina polymorpha TaxID=2211140 RepID=A0A2Z5FYB8_9BACT|nr:DUF1259 domain-containing protein [Acidisarcina polymorpha]AXC11395.1 putative CONSERVED LIPOPROTEIN LPQO [Acidisarcina polymorpha]